MNILKVAFCNECYEIFVSEIRDNNPTMLDTYREKEGLISIEEIEMILENMILERPLSLLLVGKALQLGI